MSERKIQILHYLLKQGGGPCTTTAIASVLELRTHNARMLLMKYSRQKLLKRQRTGQAYSYELTEKGLQRLQYLAREMPEIFEALTQG